MITGCAGPILGPLYHSGRWMFIDKMPVGDRAKLALRHIPTGSSRSIVDARSNGNTPYKIHNGVIALHTLLGRHGSRNFRNDYSSWQAIRRQTKIIIVAIVYTNGVKYPYISKIDIYAYNSVHCIVTFVSFLEQTKYIE